MNTLNRLHPIFQRFCAPADDNPAQGNGGSADRGDNFTPTDDDDAAEQKRALELKEAEAVAKAAKDDAALKEAGKKELEAKGLKAEGETDPKEETDPKVEGEGEGGAKRKDTRIPEARHKEILQAERDKRERVEKELAKYQQGQAIANTNEEITALEDKAVKAEDEYTKLITDGELAKAAAKMREIRAMEREINDKRTGMSIAAAEARAVEQVRFDVLVDRMEAAYPQLDPQHDDFDKEKVAEVLELKAAYQNGQGYTPTAALQKAIKYVMGTATKKQEEVTEVKPRVSAEDEAEAKKKARADDQRKKNLETAAKQPPDLKQIGQDSDKLGGQITAKDVLKMTQDDFAKLDDKALARMRGDEIEA